MSYLKNVIGSFRYAAPKIIAEKLAGFAGIGEIAKTIQNEDGIGQDALDFVKKDLIIPLKLISKTTKQRLKTGELFPSEEEQNASFMGGMGSDDMGFGDSNDPFGGMGFDDSDPFEGMSDSEDSSESSGGSTVNNVIKQYSNTNNNSVVRNVSPQNGANQQATLEGAILISSTGVASAAKTNSVIFSVGSETNSILNQIKDFQVSHGASEGAFFERNIGVLGEIIASNDEITNQLRGTAKRNGYSVGADAEISDVIKEVRVGSDKGEASFDYSGKFDTTAYLNTIQKRLKDKQKDIAGMVEMLSMSLGADPLGAAASFGVGKALSSRMLEPLNNLNKTLQVFPNLMFGKMQEIKGNTTNPFVRAFIDFFSPTDALSGNEQLASYEKGKVDFDGITRKSIVEVIPTLLTKILTAITGGKQGDELVYNFQDGKFEKKGEIVSKIVSGQNDEASSSFRDIISSSSKKMEFADLKEKEAFEREMATKLGGVARKGGLLNDETFSDDTSEIGQIINEQIRGMTTSELNDLQLKASEFKYGSANGTRDSLLSNNGQAQVMSEYGADVSRYHGVQVDGKRSVIDSMNSYSDNVQKVNIVDSIVLRVLNENSKGSSKKSKKSSPNSDSPNSGTPPPEPESSFKYKRKTGEEGSQVEAAIIGDNHGSEAFFDQEENFLKTLLNLPTRLMGRASNLLNNKISEFAYGRKATLDGNESTRGIFGSISDKLNDVIYGKDSPTDADGKRFSIIANFKQSFKDFITPIGTSLKEAKDSVFSYLNEKVLNPINEFANKGRDYIVAKFKNLNETYLKPMGESFMKSATDFGAKIRSALFGNKGSTANAADATLGLFGTLKAKFNEKIFDPIKFSLFGKKDVNGKNTKVGLFEKMQRSFDKTFLNPVKGFLFGKKDVNGKNMKLGIFTKMERSIDKNFLKPMKGFLFGKKDKNGKNLKTGIFTKMSDSINLNLINPAKGLLFGKENIAKDGSITSMTKGGIIGTIAGSFKSVVEPLKESLLEAFNKVKTSLIETFSPIGTSLKAAALDVFGSVKEVFTSMMPKTKDGKPFNLGTFLTDFSTSMGEKFSKMTGTFFEKGNSFSEVFKNWMNDKTAGLKSYLYGKDGDGSGLFDRISTKITSTMAPIKEYLIGVDGKGGIIGAAKDKVNTFLLGDGTAENQGIINKFVKPFGDYLTTNIFDPFKKTMSDSWEGTKKFFTEEIFAPLKGTLMPFVQELKDGFEFAKDSFLEGISKAFTSGGDLFQDIIGVNIGDMLHEKIVKPFTDGLKILKEEASKILKTVFKMPIDMIKKTSDRLREKHAYQKAIGREDLIYDPATGKSVPRNKLAGGASASTDDKKAAENAAVVNDAVAKGSDSDLSKTANSASSGAMSPTASKASVAKVDPASTQSSTIADKPATENAPSVKSPVAKGTQAEESKVSLSSIKDLSGDNELETQKKINLNSVKSLKVAKDSTNHLKNISSFLRKNMQNVGKNTAGILRKLGGKKAALADGVEKGTGLLSRLTSIITNPIEFLSNLGSDISDVVSTGLKTMFEPIKNILMLPMNVLKKGMDLLTRGMEGIAKGVGILFELGKDIVAGIGPFLKSAAETAGNILETLVKGAGDVFDSLVKGGATAFGVIMEIGGGILEGVGKLKGAFAALGEAAGAIATTLFDAVKFVAKGAGKLIGGAASALNIGMKSKTINIGSIDKIVKVDVVKGHLTSVGRVGNDVADAPSANGVPNTPETPSGVGDVAKTVDSDGTTKPSFIDRMKERFSNKGKNAASIIGENKLSLKEKITSRWRDAVASNTGETASHVGKLSKGIFQFLPWIGSLLMGFWSALKAGFIGKSIASAISGAKDLFGSGDIGGSGKKSKRGRIAKGAKAVGGKIANGAKAVGGKIAKGASLLKSGGAMLKGGVTGIAGYAVSSYAEGMEEGVAKTAVGTSGAMLEYGGLGSMIGTMITPGIGTAIGAAVGAAVGAVVYNWDSLKEGASSVIKAAGTFMFGGSVEYDKDGNVIEKASRGILGSIGSFFFGSDAVMDQNGNVIQDGEMSLPTMLNNTFDKMLGWIWDGIFGATNKEGDVTTVGIIPSIANFASDTFTYISDSIFGVFDSITDNILGVFKVLTNPIDSLASAFTSVAEFFTGDNILERLSDYIFGSTAEEKAEEAFYARQAIREEELDATFEKEYGHLNFFSKRARKSEYEVENNYGADFKYNENDPKLVIPETKKEATIVDSDVSKPKGGILATASNVIKMPFGANITGGAKEKEAEEARIKSRNQNGTNSIGSAVINNATSMKTQRVTDATKVANQQSRDERKSNVVDLSILQQMIKAQQETNDILTRVDSSNRAIADKKTAVTVNVPESNSVAMLPERNDVSYDNNSIVRKEKSVIQQYIEDSESPLASMNTQRSNARRIAAG
jgi:hypothetical protein